jgi:8-oxo-dGTP diphosphatase
MKRASLIITKNKKLLVVYRNKMGKEYYVLPGGSVERGETIKQATIREAKEETNLKIKLDKLLWRHKEKGQKRLFYYFLVTTFDGKLKLGNPETQRQSADNIYRLKWVPIKNIKAINLKPNFIKLKLIKFFYEQH